MPRWVSGLLVALSLGCAHHAMPTLEAPGPRVPARDQATTPEQCAQAEPWTADDPYGCSWTPIYVATLAADGSCSFEPMGGSCTEFAYGDTDCGQHPAACGFEVFGEVAEDGTMTIARTPSSCEQDPFVLPLVLCSNGIDAGTGDTGSDTGGPTDEEMLCTCGCAPSYP